MLYLGQKRSIICSKVAFYEITLYVFGCPEGWSWKDWMSKWHPDALQAKAMDDKVLARIGCHKLAKNLDVQYLKGDS